MTLSIFFFNILLSSFVIFFRLTLFHGYVFHSMCVCASLSLPLSPDFLVLSLAKRLHWHNYSFFARYFLSTVLLNLPFYLLSVYSNSDAVVAFGSFFMSMNTSKILWVAINIDGVCAVVVVCMRMVFIIIIISVLGFNCLVFL